MILTLLISGLIMGVLLTALFTALRLWSADKKDLETDLDDSELFYREQRYWVGRKEEI